jgi:hypothetical protein
MNLQSDPSPTGFYNYLPKLRRRTGKIGPLKQGLLKVVGYTVNASEKRRRSAVKRAVKKYGRNSTIRKLNAVAVYTRRRSPVKSMKFKADMKYAQTVKENLS